MGKLLPNPAILIFMMIDMSPELFPDPVQFTLQRSLYIIIVGVELLLKCVFHLSEEMHLVLISFYIGIEIVELFLG